MNVRLIASDIDGTLLRDGAMEISQELFGQIRRLEEKGILFCPASGRQYQSLRQLFAPVADKVPFLCENGAAVYGPGAPGPVWSKTVMSRTLAENLCQDIMALPGVEVLISGVNTSYLCQKAPDYEDYIRWFTGNNIARAAAPEAVPEEIIKVSAYCPGLMEETQTALCPKWEKHFRTAVAGEAWLDFTLADKGMGLEQLCRKLKLLPEQVMAFGDNFNDVPMLQLAGFPYIMDSASPQLRERFPVCSSVEEILRTL